MKTETWSDDEKKLISSFSKITMGQTIETAIEFLEATNWNLEEAINLFLIHRQNQHYGSGDLVEEEEQQQQHTILPPLPSFRDYEAEPSDSTTFYSLSRPLVMLFDGSFEDAKSFSSRENLWLLMSLRSTTEFSSQNQDLWSNDAFPLAIESGFILLQVYDDTTEGQQISAFYKVESAPSVVLLIDPITGQKMRSWSGEVEAQSFVEDLMKYIDSGPHEHVASLTSNKRIKTEKICFESSHTNDDVDLSTLWDDHFEECSEGNFLIFPENHSSGNDIVVPSLGEEYDKEETCLEFPALTEEPKEDCDRSLVCTVCIRFPDGRRNERKFLKSEPVQLLWSFCYSHMEASERKAFKLVQAIPGASKTLDYAANATFDQSGIANSIISVT